MTMTILVVIAQFGKQQDECDYHTRCKDSRGETWEDFDAGEDVDFDFREEGAASVGGLKFAVEAGLMREWEERGGGYEGRWFWITRT